MSLECYLSLQPWMLGLGLAATKLSWRWYCRDDDATQPSAPGSDSSEDERENRNTGAGLRRVLCTILAAVDDDSNRLVPYRA